MKEWGYIFYKRFVYYYQQHHRSIQEYTTSCDQ